MSPLSIKNRKSNKQTQVTFRHSAHPTSGPIFTISWRELKDAIENRLKEGDDVFSFKVTPNGVEVYNTFLMSMDEYEEFRRKFIGGKK